MQFHAVHNCELYACSVTEWMGNDINMIISPHNLLQAEA